MIWLITNNWLELKEVVAANLTNYPEICIQGQSKSTKDLCYDSESQCQDLNPIFLDVKHEWQPLDQDTWF
jgi:hypothetical protein